MNNIIEKKSGYKQLKKKPTKKELSDYYENFYYQEAKSSYEKTYSKKEIKFFQNKQKNIECCLKKIITSPFSNLKFLDIGCGEGWTLNHFYKLGCIVKGVDFSSYGIEKFNSEVSHAFTKSDIYEFILNEQESVELWDIIHIGNVIEHVLDPEHLLSQLKNLLASDGIIVCTFPNDYSPLQNKLLQLNKIDNEFWISIPDHISYFNKKSFEKMAKSIGFSSHLTLADFPIDFFLMNDHSNYIKDHTKGKQAHFSRIEIVNMLNKMDANIAAEIFLKLGELGFGRNLTSFLKK